MTREVMQEGHLLLAPLTSIYLGQMDLHSVPFPQCLFFSAGEKVLI